MANWDNLGQSVQRGYLLGRQTGGKLSGLGQALGQVVGAMKEDRLKKEAIAQEQQTQINAMTQKKQLLGMEEASKIRVAQAEPDYQIKKAIADKISGGMSGTGNSDLFTRGILAKETGVPFEMLQTPEEQNAKLQKEIDKSQFIEASKPYNEKEAATIAVTDSTVPLIDEIMGMIKKEGNIFGNWGLGDKITTAPLSGQSRLAAWMQPPKAGGIDLVSPIKKGLTVGKGQELGKKLSEITQIAFEKGGSNLTAQEIQASLAGVNPEYKTEKEWLTSLERTKQQLLRKKELILKRPIGNKQVETATGKEGVVGKYTFTAE